MCIANMYLNNDTVKGIVSIHRRDSCMTRMQMQRVDFFGNQRLTQQRWTSIESVTRNKSIMRQV